MMPWITDENGITWGKKGQGKIFPGNTPDFAKDFGIDAEVEVAEVLMYEGGVIHSEGFVKATQDRDGWFNVTLQQEG